MKLFKHLITVLFATMALQAGATSYSGGDYADGSFSFTSSKKFLVSDVFSFSLSGPSTLDTTLSFKGGLGLLGLGLYKDNTGSPDSLIGTIGLFGINSSGSSTFAGLSSGNYYYGVLGGFLPKAKYTLTSVATAVPEPGAVLMALLGAGALVFAGRRHRRNNKASA